MTTIEQNKQEIGKIAVEKLIMQINKKEMDSELFLHVQTKLLKRQSIKNLKE